MSVYFIIEHLLSLQGIRIIVCVLLVVNVLLEYLNIFHCNNLTVNVERYAGLNFCSFQQYSKSFPVNI